MLRRHFPLAVLAAAAVACAAAGCKSAAPRLPRAIGSEVLGALAPAAMRETYGTPAFVVRDTAGGGHVAIQDADLPAEARVDDTDLLIFVEGAGDTVAGFRWTARLLAESPYGFHGAGDGLVIVLLKWCETTNAVTEHMNHAAQRAGAARLAEMLEVHRRRHGAAGRVSLIGFSAGTRVIEMAFGGAAGNQAWHPEALARVDNIVFLGSSVGSEEDLPFAPIRGRFLNFVNPRDTHFGDRAAYVAPAGESADLLKLLKQGTIQRRPRFGASVAGFMTLATLTAPEQFEAVEAAEASAGPGARGPFRMVNVPVPPLLMAFSVFGLPLYDDDLDDYVNLAPNHYVMVGRGPGGNTDLPSFKQYSASAAEFVQEQVASAALHGRLYRFRLKTVATGANPLGLPLPVPWAIFGGTQKAAPEGQDAKPDAPPPAEKPKDAPPPPEAK